jgi:hypothetical protein
VVAHRQRRFRTRQPPHIALNMFALYQVGAFVEIVRGPFAHARDLFHLAARFGFAVTYFAPRRSRSARAARSSGSSARSSLARRDLRARRAARARAARLRSAPGQVQMSQLIERGFLESAHTIVEAGTGVGKSLAYLVPALRSGKKIVISTATIALQEQLVRKDIPLVVGRSASRRASNCSRAAITISAARSSSDARRAADRAERDDGSDVGVGDRTETGDRAELPFAPPAATSGKRSTPTPTIASANSATRFRDCWFFKRATPRVRRRRRRQPRAVLSRSRDGRHALAALRLRDPRRSAPVRAWATAALTATLSPSGRGA